jgi:mono/diheme cytochrome c family protein
MPRLPLDEQDTVDLASYLLGLSGSDGEEHPKLATTTPDSVRAQKGKALVQLLNCSACHSILGAKNPQIPIHKLDGGCLADTSNTSIPRYDLSQRQRRALTAYLAQGNLSLVNPRRTVLTLEALNCLSCHERAGHGGPELARLPYFTGDHNLGDTGRLPPPLTDIGRKLTLSSLELAVQGNSTVRPYLQTRMPVFGASVAKLATLFSEIDIKKDLSLSNGDIEAGRKLLGNQGGMNCITCHRWGDRASLGIQGPELSTLLRRVRPEWLHGYLIDPAAHRPGTLMPSFWPGGKSSNATVLAGDTDRQIASILAFARDGKGLPEGFPALTSSEFELVPRARPIVLRTFFEGVGTHAILVGFPAGFHLAYDGKAGRPALAWKGRFFDAYGTWFSRFAPFEKPLGESVVTWPAPVTTQAEIRCDGYRLDPAGVPSFLLSIGGVPVEDRYEATAQGLRRTLTWKPELLPTPTLMHPSGVAVTTEQSGAGKLSYLYTW